MDLTRDQPIPVYYQLKTLLTEEILSGVYGTDGRLPTEHELCERFGLSRTPVTHALTDLAAEGVVLRRRRHGTFVNPHWLARRADSGEVRVLMPAFDRWAPHLRAGAPGIRLSVAETELNEVHGAFVRAVAEGRAPDLAIIDSVWVAEFAASGFLWPLEELDPSWVENELRADFLEPFVDVHRIGDGTLAVQAEMDLAGMWYERAAIGADAPRTWEELQQTGRRLVGRRGGPVLVMPAGPSADEFATYCLVALLASNAARVLGPDAVTLDSPASVEAMALIQELVDDKVLATAAPGRDRSIHMLARGEAQMAFGGSYEAPTLARSAGLELDELTDTFGFMPVPAGPRGQSSVLVGGWVYCIPRQAKQPAAAMEVLKGAVTQPAMARFFARTGQIPPRRSVAEELVGSSPFHAFTVGLLEGAITRPVTPAYALVSAQLRAMLEAVLTARLSPAQAVSRAADLISAVTGLPVAH
ncbi:MAG TPA: extracellular solute-binding protein [Streptosporangiaceae bacterium]|jgi:ABC-type glycerol-3-phosphate transport system substrate-binding protein/DNA-binding transcriptional regulator YhcF (GntR family)|nr:extracellular solute-binding protein [Streptosporangiaceae bacterium]